MTEADNERDEEGEPSTSLAWAAGNPLRQRILDAVADGRAATSTRRLATELELPLGVVSYHVSVLHALGAVGPGQIDEDAGASRG